MIITAKCSCCGQTAEHVLTRAEQKALDQYRIYGRTMGKLQDIFPNIPAWIRSGAIDTTSGGFCICPKCN